MLHVEHWSQLVSLRLFQLRNDFPLLFLTQKSQTSHLCYAQFVNVFPFNYAMIAHLGTNFPEFVICIYKGFIF